MPVNIVLKPNILCWSKNYMHYVFQYLSMTPGDRVQIEFIDPNNGFAVLAQVEYPIVASSGFIYMKDIDRIVDNFISYGLPSKITSGVSEVIEECATMGTTFNIRYRTWSSTGVSSWTTHNYFVRILKGGIGNMAVNKEYSINNATPPATFASAAFYPPNGRFCTYVPSGRAMAPTEYGWLLYVTEVGAVSASPLQTVQYSVKYLDGTGADFNRTIPLGSNGDYYGRCWWVPTGIEQAKIDPMGKGVMYYDIKVLKATGGVPEILASYRVYADYRPRYNKAVLYYRNSMGGIDQIALDGSMQWQSGEVEKKEYSQPRVYPQTNYDGANPFFESEMRLQFKGTTCFINKEHKAALADLHNTTAAWMLIGGEWLNMRVPAQKMEAISSEDGLHSYTIEFETAQTYRTLPKQLAQLV